jgi:hypothetical protein
MGKWTKYGIMLLIAILVVYLSNRNDTVKGWIG